MRCGAFVDVPASIEDWQIRTKLLRRLSEFKAVHTAWHDHICEKQIYCLVLVRMQNRQSLGTRTGREDGHPFNCKDFGDYFPNFGIIFHDQDDCGHFRGRFDRT